MVHPRQSLQPKQCQFICKQGPDLKSDSLVILTATCYSEQVSETLRKCLQDDLIDVCPVIVIRKRITIGMISKLILFICR